jgi:CheY-specific phosphatase CheX
MVNREQLQEVLDLQKSVHVKLGVLALNLGYMNSAQVQEVHQQQMKQDKRFGEIAIQLGYLTEKQLLTLLSSQKQGHLQLSQALIDKKYLTLTGLENALESYKDDCQLTNEQLELLKQGNIDEIVPAFLNFDDPTCINIYNDYTALLLKNIVRLLDESPFLKKEALPNKYSAEILVSQEIQGKYNLITSIAADKKTVLRLASKFAGEQFMELDEMAKASITEFLNVHNGIFLVNMSNQNIELQMNPQEIYQNVSIEKNNGTYIIPIYITDGKIYLIISNKGLN